MAKPTDLDALLGFNEPEPEQHTTKVTLFGRQWTVRCDINAFVLSSLASGDAGAISKFLTNIIVEEDWPATLSAQRNLDPERLGRIVAALVEAASERPTESPARSSRTAKNRTSGPRSVGG